MTPWLLLCISTFAGASWALYERSKRKEAEGEARMSAEFARSAHQRAESEHAWAEEQVLRANRLELAAFAMTEACRAEVPRVIAEIRDPADAARVAGDRLLAAFQRAIERTSPAPGAELHREGAPPVPSAGGK